MEWSNRYFPEEVEQRLYQYWEKEGCFSLSKKQKQEKKLKDQKFFSIVLPPPNVTGSLHLGHALNHTIQDCLIRWKKMSGFQTVWLPGTDHAGIATQIQVEKELAKANQTKQNLGREKFLKKVWSWKHIYGNTIIDQMKRLGDACDWSENLFTLDPSSVKAVKKAFVHLYNRGWIYRGTRLVNWSSGLSSAISDLEVEYKEVQSHLWKIRYPLEDNKNFLIIATTRPETLIADQAVAVHPNDSRYKKHHGKKAILPLVGRPLPIITDSYVDPQFGTGVLKVTPAHDFNDYKIGKTHGLKILNILNKNGCMNKNAGPYEGLSMLQAREKIISDLKEQGLFESVEPYQHQVAFCSRSNSIVEPFLSEQWFMKMNHLAQKGLATVMDGHIEFIPSSWIKTFKHWMLNIDDWCISRQLWWGHRIPAWFCSDCKQITVSEADVHHCSHCHSSNIKQEEDVLDTWFSSALWPMSVLKWPEQKLNQNPFYPTSVLVTAPDILFFWVARMIMMSLEFQNRIPFKKVYLHGVVRDNKGRKMSKSLGNGEDPIDLINEYGSDALRLFLLSSHARGRDVRFSRENISACRNFLNKLWNAGRFIHYITNENPPIERPKEFSPVDQWILNKLKKTELKISKDLEEFRFSSACMTAYNFSWALFCDWYLEWIKPIVYSEDKNKKQSACWTVFYVFNHIIRLLHPFIPFITEEIYQKWHIKKSILFATYPEGQWPSFGPVEDEIDLIKDIISTFRHLRGESNIKPSQKVTGFIFIPEQLSNINQISTHLKNHMDVVLFLAKLKKLNFEKTTTQPSLPLHTIPEIKISILLETFEDQKISQKKLEKKINKLKTELERLNQQLSLKDFILKAPKKIVQEKKKRKNDIENLLQNLSHAFPHKKD